MRSIILIIIFFIIALFISAGCALGMQFLAVLPFCIGAAIGVLGIRQNSIVLVLAMFGIFIDFFCAQMIGMSAISIIFTYFVARALDQMIKVDAYWMPFIRAIGAAFVGVLLSRLLRFLIYEEIFNVNVLPSLAIHCILLLAPVLVITAVIKKLFGVSS